MVPGTGSHMYHADPATQGIQTQGASHPLRHPAGTMYKTFEGRDSYLLVWVQGVGALSVNWGAWAGSGMAEKTGIERMERQGFGALQPAAGVAAMAQMLAGLATAATKPQLLSSVFLWDRYMTEPFLL